MSTKKQNPFTQEDNDFLDELNSGPVESQIYTTAQHGYMRNLDRGQLQQLENIYKRNINQDFVLCFHCSSDILKMVLDIYGEREKYVDVPQQEEPTLESYELTEEDLAVIPEERRDQFKVGDVIQYPTGSTWIDNLPAATPSAPKTDPKAKTTRKK